MENSEIEVRCLEIVDELIHEHRQWVTYELLVSIVLDRFSVTKLEDLGVTHVENIPTLHLALELNRRISSFLHVYCANRGIVTLLNLEVDTCAMLRTFHYPAVSDLKKKFDRSAVDPNEIGIGIGADDARASSSSRVEDFGLGELQSHPYVRSLFPTVGVANQEKLKSVGDVLSGLCDYLKRARSQASDNYPNKNMDVINVDELKSFLLEEVWSSDAYDSLDQAGIDLKYVSKHEILACNQQLALLEDIQTGDKYSNVAETAVGIMRNKRLYDDHAHYVSPSAKKVKTRGDGLAPGHVDLVLNNRHNDNKAHSLLAEEIPAEDLQELCFAKEWAGNSATTAAVVKDVGRWGEALVYHFLVSRAGFSPHRKVLWVNKDEESQAAYDLIVEESVAEAKDGDKRQDEGKRTKTTFIEVKATRFPDRNVFDISPNEWAFATADPPLRYDLYRVYNAGDPNNVRITIVKDLYRQIKDQKVRLALVL